MIQLFSSLLWCENCQCYVEQKSTLRPPDRVDLLKKRSRTVKASVRAGPFWVERVENEEACTLSFREGLFILKETCANKKRSGAAKEFDISVNLTAEY